MTEAIYLRSNNGGDPMIVENPKFESLKNLILVDCDGVLTPIALYKEIDSNTPVNSLYITFSTEEELVPSDEGDPLTAHFFTELVSEEKSTWPKGTSLGYIVDHIEESEKASESKFKAFMTFVGVVKAVEKIRGVDKYTKDARCGYLLTVETDAFTFDLFLSDFSDIFKSSGFPERMWGYPVRIPEIGDKIKGRADLMGYVI